MAHDEIESSICELMNRCFDSNHRLLFVILGENGLHNVPILYKFVRKKTGKRNIGKEKLSVLCLSHNPEAIRKFSWHSNEDCDITYCSYSELANIHCRKFNFVVVCDIEDNVQPQHLATIVKSTYGPGILIFLFSKISEVKKLTSPKLSDCMKTRFRRRLGATFEMCPCSVILDDKLNVLQLPKWEYQHFLNKKRILNDEDKVDEKYSGLAKPCLTVDQTKFLKLCLDTLKNKSSYSTVSASSHSGRGKSSVLGLAIAGAIDMKYSNIFVSSLYFGNVLMVFKFLVEGLAALNYEEGVHYDIIEHDNNIFNTTVLGLNIFKDNRQAVRFIFPGEVENQLEDAELVVIDDAAAIPLSLLKKLIGPHVALMASSIEGCGASGKFLYENMINEIRLPTSSENQSSSASLFPASDRNTLVKIELNEPLHFAYGDGVEKWINHVLCLENSISCLSSGAPPLELCRLFYICQDTLFSHETFSERFLQQLMTLFVCSKRIITPDTLFTIADAEDYHIFCLLPPLYNSGKTPCDILCAIMVHKVQQIPWNVVYCGVNQSNPLHACFDDWKNQSSKENYLQLQGIHIVDIVTHPTYRCKDFGYDFRALQLVQEFYSGKLVPLDDKPFLYSTKSKKSNVNPEQNLPLLLQLTDVEPEKMDYMLAAYYLTSDQLKFWKRFGFVPMYVGCDKNPAEEHLCIMMKDFDSEEIVSYLKDNWTSFLAYFTENLGSNFKHFSPLLSLDLLISSFCRQMPKEVLSKEIIDVFLNPQGMKKLVRYCRNLSDLHSVVPCIRILSELYFKHRLIKVDMSVLQRAVLMCFGLQHKSISETAKTLKLRPSQTHAKLNQVTIMLTKYLNSIIEKEVDKTIPVRDINMVPVSKSIDEELDEAAQKVGEELKTLDFSRFAIKGSEDDWEKALHSGRKTFVSIKRFFSHKKPGESPQVKVMKSEKRKK